jgi:Icc-related predicted phosphoesterase
MKLAICSDLHLEFGTLELKNTENADALVIAGDICVASDLVNNKIYLQFFEQVSKEFNHVFYVMGNHEHYQGDFATSEKILKDHLSHLENLHILEKSTFHLDDYVFVGGTVWTDMNGGDTMTMNHVRTMMNDFRVIKNSNRYTYRKVPVYQKTDDGQLIKNLSGKNIQTGMKMKEEVSKFSPEDAMHDHKLFMDYLTHVLSEHKDKKVVMIGHHAPSNLSVHPRYANDDLMNGGYRSSLDFFIEDHPEIVLWVHGHTHHRFDYTIGNTRVFCNPRGYINYEQSADYFQLRFVDV